ncbi:MAG: hypothetical protein AB7P76_12310 [Candidatus Melainabacteria bacterium]
MSIPVSAGIAAPVSFGVRHLGRSDAAALLTGASLALGACSAGGAPAATETTRIPVAVDKEQATQFKVLQHNLATEWINCTEQPLGSQGSMLTCGNNTYSANLLLGPSHHSFKNGVTQSDTFRMNNERYSLDYGQLCQLFGYADNPGQPLQFLICQGDTETVKEPVIYSDGSVDTRNKLLGPWISLSLMDNTNPAPSSTQPGNAVSPTTLPGDPSTTTSTTQG